MVARDVEYSVTAVGSVEAFEVVQVTARAMFGISAATDSAALRSSSLITRSIAAVGSLSI